MKPICHARCWLLACLLLAGCQRPGVPLPQQAYIWQRAWTPAVREAMQASGNAVVQWRVLVAEADGNGRFRTFAVDRAALRASDKPVVVVLRIDGVLANANEAGLIDGVLSVWRDWEASGVHLAGLEIDHDAGTASLPAYANFLRDLRAQLGPDVPLSITALPAWLSSPALGAVLAPVDQSVLQVHAVRNPRLGLFDPELARRWADAYAQRSAKPFLLALPDYGSRVSWNAQGQITSVASETDVLDAQGDARELLATPAQVAGFLRELRRDPPPHLVGIAWFRLPTAQDRRAWSLGTWLAVIRGEPLRTNVVMQATASSAPGAPDLWLENRGQIDAMLPPHTRLPAPCMMADGVNGYRLQRDGNGLALERMQPGLLRAGDRRKVGWARCAIQGESWHVDD